MKILFVISSLGIGGEQRVASILTERFNKKGHSVDIATFEVNEKSFDFDKNISINLIKSKKSLFNNLKRVISIRKLIKKNRYDVVIGFAIIPSILCSLAAIGLKSPVVVCERNDPSIYRLSWKMIRRCAYKFSSGAVFQTSDAQNYFNDWFKGSSIIIPNPLMIDILPQTTETKRNKIIVNTARLTNAKNHTLLINAFSKIEKQFPEYILHIYGDGPNKDQLMSLIESLKLKHKILINEAIPNVLDKIHKADLFVLSSNNEGFPNSLAEAMAIGLPVISTDCRIGGPKDMIDNMHNGILVKNNNVDELAKAMEMCLSNSSLRSKLSQNARNIRLRLDANIISDNWLRYLRTVSKTD